MDASWSFLGGLRRVLEASSVPWRRREVVLGRLGVVLRLSCGVLRWSWGVVRIFQADLSFLGASKKASWSFMA